MILRQLVEIETREFSFIKRVGKGIKLISLRKICKVNVSGNGKGERKGTLFKCLIF